VNEEHAQVRVPAFGDSPQMTRETTRVFGGCQPQIAGEVTPSRETAHVSHERPAAR
jgi:hypothetical protein